jgi:hypothetical protein
MIGCVRAKLTIRLSPIAAVSSARLEREAQCHDKSERRPLRPRLQLRADPAETATAVLYALRVRRDRPFYACD